jgi:hypothetical protein
MQHMQPTKMKTVTSYTRSPKSEASLTCEWFAMCDNDAIEMVLHPILGQMPVCNPCIKKMELEHLVVQAVGS